MLVCLPCDCTSANLNKTSVREKSRSVYLPIGEFSELFDDIPPLVLDMRRVCVVVDSLISAEKVCDCVIFAWCWQAELRYVVAWLSCCTKIFCASHKNASSVFSFADWALENQFSTQGTLVALNHRPVFADTKVIIRVLCFNQFVVCSKQNPVVYRTAKKAVFC